MPIQTILFLSLALGIILIYLSIYFAQSSRVVREISSMIELSSMKVKEYLDCDYSMRSFFEKGSRATCQIAIRVIKGTLKRY